MEGTTHRTKRIGEWLLHIGLLTKRQLESAIEAQDGNPENRLGEVLIQKGYITQDELDATLAVQEVLNGRSSLKDFPITPKTLSLLPEHFCLQYEVLPLAQIAMRLLVATADGRNFEALDRITIHTGLIVVTIETPREELLGALGKVFNRNLLPSPSSRPAPPPPRAAQQPPQPDSSNDAAVVDLVNSILEEAVHQNATDIHLTPYEHVLEVRCRADGIMRKLLEIPKKLEPLVLKRLNQLASVSNAEQRLLQHERFSLRINGEPLSLQISSAPTLWGERVKLRIRRSNSEMRPLSALGMNPEDLFGYKQLLRGASGIVLIAGPKGNGKATTLHATVGYLDKLTNHVAVIEESIVSAIPSVTQIPLNPKQGFTLEAAIESALDQDIDVLVVGRVRLRSHVEALLDASQKGILVIASMDAPDAGSALAYLMSLGLSSYLLGANLKLILAQRLVRQNCPHCSIEYAATPSERTFLGVALSMPVTLQRGLGCDYCQHTGYMGQESLFEMMTVTQGLYELMTSPQTSLATIEARAHDGLSTLLDDAKRKIMAGRTTISEVIRVLGETDLLGSA